MPASGHTHIWEKRVGRPLACVDCGELWPGDPNWPPEPQAPPAATPSEGRVSWSRRVGAMVHELREVA